MPEVPRANAEERARELLLSVLDNQQKESLSANGYFDVQGSDGNTYRLGPRQIPALVNSDAIMQEYCVALRPESLYGSQYPADDLFVTLALLIQTDAPRFLRIARPLGPRHF